jgi:hypothetical protein
MFCGLGKGGCFGTGYWLFSPVPDENWVEGVGLGEGLSPVESKCEKSVYFGASKAQPNQ